MTTDARPCLIKPMEEVRHALTASGQLWFKYIDLPTAEVLHFVRNGWDGWIAVIGHPDNGTYEWVGRDDAEFEGQDKSHRQVKRSDCGYGSSVAALRDGLVAMVD
ncbi:MAG: hypothetical protein AB7O62_00160 [Pirellulales bacterium]